MSEPLHTKALTLNSKDAMLTGVCAGIARWLGWDVTLVRVAYVLASFLSAAFPGIIVYIALWIIMPADPEA